MSDPIRIWIRNPCVRTGRAFALLIVAEEWGAGSCKFPAVHEDVCCPLTVASGVVAKDVELASFDSNLQGSAGFRIDGPSVLALAGQVVDVIDDMNGDGLQEVLVGASTLVGATYVVFGKADTLC